MVLIFGPNCHPLIFVYNMKFSKQKQKQGGGSLKKFWVKMIFRLFLYTTLRRAFRNTGSFLPCT